MFRKVFTKKAVIATTTAIVAGMSFAFRFLIFGGKTPKESADPASPQARYYRCPSIQHGAASAARGPGRMS